MTRIAGTGCSLLDWIHADVDFSSGAFRSLRSRNPGDGGLEPGALVFASDFERFAGRKVEEALRPLLGGREADACNVGGPGLVALIHVAQLLCAGSDGAFAASFAGAVGDDRDADRLLGMARPSGLDLSGYVRKSGRTPFTLVLSDPRHDEGRGERCFVNEIGVAGLFRPADLPDAFYDADIAVFGGTALTPVLHDELAAVLARAQARGALTVVNTVYDFRNQSRDPVRPWPLGAGDEAWPLVDLLVTDHEEALRLSGAADASGALAFFRDRGVGAAVVTAGTREIRVASWTGRRIAPRSECSYPVSAVILRELEKHPERRGDTTGCGDNFAGGLIAAAAMQLDEGKDLIDLDEALAWAVASGGFACFHMGGVFHESRPGEKRALLEPYVKAWRRQVGATG